jgi:hypothetical protein
MITNTKIEIDKKVFQGNGTTIKFEYQKEDVIKSGFVVYFEGRYHAYTN